VDDEGLFGRASRTCREQYGDQVYIRGLVEFSNHCVRNCRYCGLRRDNAALTRYRMTGEEILTVVTEVRRQGIRTVVLQSGDDFYYDRTALCRQVAALKQACPGMAVTLSIGERPREDYRACKEHGADRYLIKQETIDPGLYRRCIRDGVLSAGSPFSGNYARWDTRWEPAALSACRVNSCGIWPRT
jgi:biotin synthase